MLEYRTVRYHLFLNHNEDFPGSVENKYLQKVYEDFAACHEVTDDEADAVFDCTDLFWKFIKEHDDRIAYHRRPSSQHVDRWGSPVAKKLQVKTVDDGSLQVIEHDRVYRPYVEPIDNPFPEVRVFQRTQVHRIGGTDDRTIGNNVFKVEIEGAEYCLKTVFLGAEETLLKELTALRNIPSHPNIIPLIGVVATEDQRIDAFLTPYINGTTLNHVTNASDDQKELWKCSITDAISFLHARDLVWGDAKPHNVMIEKGTSRPVLVDFGGGYSPGWVDRELSDTRGGDLQGLKRIVDFIDDISVP